MKYRQRRGLPPAHAAVVLPGSVTRGAAVPTDFGRAVFMCTKPLQFLTCASIVRACGIQQPLMLLAVESIADVEGFSPLSQARNMPDCSGKFVPCRHSSPPSRSSSG